ncbi:malonyl-CoA decarboxylase [Marinobacter fonticola]|uniref:malonyl-CoA decarboxylase n=1 Tax=Marinobacter fonticola TaxID=2603215 RepID=UPI0011E680F2|nr:malonyl-CoA decarboxylase [Marinobacter fonticola]
MNMSFLQELFSNITQREALLRRRTGNGLVVDHNHLLEACQALLKSDGEASSISHASHALEIYARLDDDSKTRFFERLAKDFSADPREIDHAYAAYRKGRENAALQRLFDVCEPRRQELLRRLNLSTGGTYELVRMREDLLRLMRSHKDFEAINADFTHLFASWFNRGFLVVKRIDWNTPAAILERIIRYEAVHKIRDWDDLRRRLDNRDRRCFAFFHPAIGDEPLIFVEVALTRGLPEQIQPILDAGSYDIEDPEAADTAAFFGISNCQVGLRGISFGNFLIKQVVQELKQELPKLKNFVTLSPMPGFRKWLESTYLEETVQQPDKVGLEPEALATLQLLKNPEWPADPEQSERLNAVIRPLAARYLLKEKNRDGQPLNPVARFHLGNGAELHRINWQGDISEQGIQQSTGLMVNYLYVIDAIERNHEQYITDHTIVCSSSVRDLSRRGRKLLKGDTGK